jgi:hypothetical protein
LVLDQASGAKQWSNVMGFSSWLRSVMVKRIVGTQCQHRSAIEQYRPRLEVLEGRWLPSTLNVTNNLDNGSLGSLRYEIGQATRGDTIAFASSVDGQTITLTNGQLLINTSLTINGPGASQLAVSGESGSRVFCVAPGATVTLSGLTIEAGNGWADDRNFDRDNWDGFGGAILNLGTLTVSGCALSGNSADNEGGGIYNATGCLLTVSGCSLSCNSAQFGGGIFNAAKATASVTGSTLSGNSAYSGGGIYNNLQGKLTMSDSHFIGNDIVGKFADRGGNTFA